MDFSLTEEQELLLRNLRELITRNFDDGYFKKCDAESRAPLEFLHLLGEEGYTLLGVPEELGGVPADVFTQMLVIEEVGRLGAPAYWMGGAHCVHNMLRFGSPEQLRLTAESAAKGIPGYSLAITEPQAGSDNTMIGTTYVRKNGKVYLNGQKTFITGAADFPSMIVVARNPEITDSRKCFTMWWVDTKAKGLTMHHMHKVGWKMISNCEVFLDNVEVAESDMVGEEGNGFIHLMKNFEIERIAVSTYALGPAECAYNDAASYANQRVQFGKTIGSFQMVQEKLTSMAVKIENMKHFIYKAAWMDEQGMSMRKYSAMCKLYCANASQEVVDDAMQIMGGIGYMDDCRVSRLWRDARLNRIGGGTDQIMVHIAGREILKEFK